MKTCLLSYLGTFVAGVFVGAGLWLALIISAVALAAWWFGKPQPAPDRSRAKHLSHFGFRSPGGR